MRTNVDWIRGSKEHAMVLRWCFACFWHVHGGGATPLEHKDTKQIRSKGQQASFFAEVATAWGHDSSDAAELRNLSPSAAVRRWHALPASPTGAAAAP